MSLCKKAAAGYFCFKYFTTAILNRETLGAERKLLAYGTPRLYTYDTHKIFTWYTELRFCRICPSAGVVQW